MVVVLRLLVVVGEIVGGAELELALARFEVLPELDC
jgi:hypothetical protein